MSQIVIDDPLVFIETLGASLRNKRSDIADICAEYLSNRTFDERCIEHRFVKARIPAKATHGVPVEIEYDTLTTELAYHVPGEYWTQAIEHEYVDE